MKFESAAGVNELASNIGASRGFRADLLGSSLHPSLSLSMNHMVLGLGLGWEFKAGTS